jgi:hypothetical protein
MHDKHGRVIEVGDLVIVPGYHSNVKVPQAARVVVTVPTATTCNVQAVYPQIVTGHFTAGECEIVQKADGTNLAPPTKPGA